MPWTGLACLLLSSCGIFHHERVMETVDYPEKIREQRIEVKGRPLFTDLQDKSSFTIDGFDANRYGAVSWPENAPPPAELDTSRQLRFEILRHESGTWNYTNTSMAKISDGDRVIFDSSVCEVHRKPMTRVVETCNEYADHTQPSSFTRARKERFPNSGTAFPACTYYGNRYVVWRCPTCAKNVSDWGRKHLKHQPLM